MNILFKNFKVENENFIYIPLYIFLKDKIEKREISYKLPSIRKVANFLNISSNTVAKSYLELEKINYVKSIKGSGVFINKNIFSEKNISSLNLENDDNFNIIKTLKIDFINSTPNYSYLPVNDIKYAINYILDRDQELALINEGPFGSFELRESIKNSLINLEIMCNTENIHILSGAQQGIDLISKTLGFSKAHIAIEHPTYLGALKSFKNQDFIIHPIDVENDGLNISQLKQLLLETKIRFIYLMANFQTPTGVTISQKKRLQLLELSKSFDFYIIEDDSASDLYYSSKASVPLKALDVDDRVIYIKSFSKIFMPGFRLGFILVPEKLLTSFLNNKILADSNTSTLYQKSFALLLEKGLIEKHMNLCRKNFKSIQDSIVEELKKIPNISFIIPSGGCSFWIKLPKNISSLSVYNKLLINNVGIVPGSNYGFDNFIKLNFSRVNEKDINSGISLLKETIEFFINLNI